jgi:hypothetical protein
MALFFPEVYQAIDFTHLKFLQQEVFTDVTAGERHEVDIIVETRLGGNTSAVIILWPQRF